MSDYLYYCAKCNSLISDTYDDEEVPCDLCGAIMTPLHITEDEWNSMPDTDKIALLDRHKTPPQPQVQKQRPVYSEHTGSNTSQAQRAKRVTPGQQSYSTPVTSAGKDYYDKFSGMSIAALVLSFFGCTSIIGLILGIIDLTKNDGRKKGMSIAAVIISGIMVVGIIFAATNQSSKKDQIANNNMTELVEAAAESAAPTPVDEPKSETQTKEKSDNEPVSETPVPEETQEETASIVEWDDDPDFYNFEATELSPGMYVIGEDLPAGAYSLTALSGGGSVKIFNSKEEVDSDDEAYYWQIADKDFVDKGALAYNYFLSNLRVAKGQIVKLDVVSDVSPNAGFDMETTDVLSGGTFIVGKDIPAGKYSFDATAGAGSLWVYSDWNKYLADDEIDFWQIANPDFAKDAAGYQDSFHNLRLENGQIFMIQGSLVTDVHYEGDNNLPSDPHAKDNNASENDTTESDFAGNGDIVAAVKKALADQNDPEIEVTDVSFDNGNLTIYVTVLRDGNAKSKKELAESTLNTLTFPILDLNEDMYNAWDNITIDFDDVGKMKLDKGMIKDDGLGPYFDSKKAKVK